MAEINDIISRINVHFHDLLDSNANPLEVALSLMDTSSIGKANYAEEFAELQQDVQDCLKSQVRNNYQGFSSSVGVYHTLVNGVNDNHQTVVDVQSELEAIRNMLQERKPIIREWQATSLRYKHTLELLDIAEELKKVPNSFEGLVSQKRFLEAHQALNSALETMVSHNMLKYPPIQQIHNFVVTQQVGLQKMLEHELLSHLYLRSPYTLNRWTDFSVDDENGSVENSLQHRILTERAIQDAQHNLTNFLTQIHEDSLEINYAKGAESDSFNYMRLLVETLVKLDRLEQVIDNILSKVVIDVRRMVEKAISDFIKKERVVVDNLAAFPTTLGDQLVSEALDQRLRMLETLTNVLCSKLIAVLEGHRVLAELVKDHMQYNLLQVYNAIESEVKSLLTSYIGTNAPFPFRRGSMESRRTAPSKHYSKTEYVGPMFEFTQETMDNDLYTEFDKLKLSLKQWVPGLGMAFNLENGGFTPYADTHKESNLSVVAPVNILNIRALATPVAEFFFRASQILNGYDMCTDRARRFITDFFHNMYLPSLRNKTERSIEEILEAQNSAEIYPKYLEVSQLPVMNGAYESIDLISKLSIVLNTNTYSRPNYADILVSLIDLVREFFVEKVDDGLQGRETVRKVVQTMATSEPLAGLNRKMRDSIDNMAVLNQLVDQELAVFASKRISPGNISRRLKQSDMLDLETFKLFALLSTTIRWVLIRLEHLRKENSSTDSPESTGLSDTYGAVIRRWWSLVDVGTERDGDAQASLIMGPEILAKFNAVVDKLEKLNDNILSYLRCDVMCRIVFHFDEMVSKGKYDGHADSAEQDPDIDLLQSNIASCYQMAADSLLARDQKFIFIGCAKLMNELFVLESSSIKGGINENGVRKMFNNILALQQVLKSVVSDPQEVNFSRAIEFYESFKTTPARVLDAARKGKTLLTESDIARYLEIKKRDDISKKENRDEHLVTQQYLGLSNQLKELFKDKHPNGGTGSDSKP